MKGQQKNRYFEKEKLELDNDIFKAEIYRRNRPEIAMPVGTEVLKLKNIWSCRIDARSMVHAFHSVHFAVFYLILFFIIGLCISCLSP